MAGHVVIGGGTGFIGSHLCKLLKKNGNRVTVISRMPGPQRISWHTLEKSGLPDDTTAVVNLAGQNVLDPTRQWTTGFKQNVFNSRVNTTQSIANAIVKAKTKPKVFVAMSGVGIYQPSLTKEYNENSERNEFDFFSKLCIEWENASKLPATVSCRQVIIRSGVVIGRDGGMIKQLYLPFYLGLGGPVATGNQPLPWIHIDDITNLIKYAIENDKVEGVLNGVAPQIITNKDFSKAFAEALWRPAIFPVPEFILNLLFNKERAKMLTEGQKVVPKRTLETGYKYIYPDIVSACKSVVVKTNK